MNKYIIKAPVGFTGKGWGLNFADGVAHTDDDVLAKKLSGKGYTVTDDDECGFVCPICQKACKTQKALDSHIAKEHPEGANDDGEE